MKQSALMPVFVDEMPSDYEQGKIYISKIFRTSKHLCACGCGQMTVMPIDDGTKWWQLVEEADGTVTFKGSVGNWKFPCQSHYMIEHNQVRFI